MELSKHEGQYGVGSGMGRGCAYLPLASGVSRSTKASEVSSLFTEAGGNAIRCAGVSRYEYSGGLK